MKISQTEIQAASRFLQNADEYTVRLALHAAYSIRRIRKTAKRERQRKEKDKQVVESVKPHNELRHAQIGRIIMKPKA